MRPVARFESKGTITRNRLPLRFFLFLAFVCWAAAPEQLTAQTLTEYPLPVDTSAPNNITLGPDGAVWFTEFQGNKVGRITTAGAITEFDIPTPNSAPRGIVAGPDGALWFVEYGGNKIGRITTAGTITEFPLGSAGGPISIAVGSDNALWFTELNNPGKIGRITLGGTISEYPVLTPNNVPRGIASGSDNALWFMELGDKVGRVTTGGTVTEYALPANSQPLELVAGFDGAIWFSEGFANKIGRITPSGTITHYPVPTPNAGPYGLTTGLDGAIWFTEPGGKKIGRMLADGSVPFEFNLTAAPQFITRGADGALWFTEISPARIGRLMPNLPSGPSPLVASVLPTSRSVQVGNTATVFASIINSGTSSLTNCRIEPDTFVNGFYSYQTTDAGTNALTGTRNTSAPLSAHGLQTFVIAIKAGAPYVPTAVQFRYICDGVTAAAAIPGVNTLQLVFDNTPVADMIAVGVTPSNDGFSHTGGPSGTGIFAVATTNIGPATPLTAKPRLSDGSMPITVTMCETNASAQCKSPPSATVSRSFGNNEASTFSLFLQASGAVAADPAKFRVFVEFLDGSNIVRGSTSTAITTQ